MTTYYRHYLLTTPGVSLLLCLNKKKLDDGTRIGYLASVVHHSPCPIYTFQALLYQKARNEIEWLDDAEEITADEYDDEIRKMIQVVYDANNGSMQLGMNRPATPAELVTELQHGAPGYLRKRYREKS